MLTAIKRLFCAAEYAEIDRLHGELASTVAQLRIAELTAARLEAEKKELVYQLDGTRKQVRALRKRSRRH
jgi:hypothetical protein